MVLDQVLEFRLRLIESDLEHIVFFAKCLDAVLQLGFLVEQAITLLHELDLILGVWGFLRDRGVPRVAQFRVKVQRACVVRNRCLLSLLHLELFKVDNA